MRDGIGELGSVYVWAFSPFVSGGFLIVEWVREEAVMMDEGWGR